VRKVFASLWLVGLMYATQTASSETLLIPVGQQQQGLSLPTTGMSEQQVIESFGKPQSIGAAVGEPPIVRWRYEGFTVYFETGHVIHSVALFKRSDTHEITAEEKP
jgi:hypothetical protein